METYVLRDPDGVLHVNASSGGTKVTWCERMTTDGQYWYSGELKLVRGKATCLLCLGITKQSRS